MSKMTVNNSKWDLTATSTTQACTIGISTGKKYIDKDLNIKITAQSGTAGAISGGGLTHGNITTNDTTYLTDTNTGYKISFSNIASRAAASYAISKAGWISNAGAGLSATGNSTKTLDKYIKAGVAAEGTATSTTELFTSTSTGINPNLAKATSNNWSSGQSGFSGIQNTCLALATVETTGLAVGDIVTITLYYKYTNIVPASGQTASAWIQGSGNVTAWNTGSFAGSSHITLSGSGEHKWSYQVTITENHLKNEYWSTNIRHDYVQSGTVQWKGFKVEKGTVETPWVPNSADTGITLISNATVTGSPSNYYVPIKTTGTGYSKITTAGWMPVGNLNTASATGMSYVSIPKATFERSGGNINVKTAGYIDSGTAGSITAANLASGNIELTQQTGTSVVGKSTASVKSGSATTPATTITANPSLSTTKETNGYKMSVSTSKSVTPSVSAGWVASGTAGTITVSGSAYIPEAGFTFSGGAASIKSSSSSASASGLGITDTDTDPGSGVYITTGGKATATRAAVTYTNTAGYFPVHTSATTASAAADGSETNVSSNKYYVTTLTVPASKTFTSVSLTAGTSSARTYLNTANVPGLTTIKKINLGGIIDEISLQGGYAYLKANDSTSGSLVYVNAYDSGATALSGNQLVVQNNKWVTNNVTPGTAAKGPYYGKTSVSAVSADTAKAVLGTASIGNATSVPDGYTENTSVVVPSQGYLKINAGYIGNTVIGLDQMLDGKADTAGTAAGQILTGYVAYDVDGKKLTGTMVDNTNNFTTLTGSNNSFTNGGYNITSTGIMRVCPPTGFANYDSTSWDNSLKIDIGTATAAEVLSGKTFTSSAGRKVSGTMPNNGTLGTTSAPKTITSQNGTYTIPAGYTSGGVVKATINNAAFASNITTASSGGVPLVSTAGYTGTNNLTAVTIAAGKTLGSTSAAGVTLSAKDASNNISQMYVTMNTGSKIYLKDANSGKTWIIESDGTNNSLNIWQE